MLKYFCSYFCHQLAERTLHINDHLLPLCSRCTGIYSGFLIGIIYQYIAVRKINRLPSLGIIVVSVMLILLLIIQGLGENYELWEFTNQGRFLIGIFCGSSISVIMFPLFNYFVQKYQANASISFKYYAGLFVWIFLNFFFHYASISYIYFYIVSFTGLTASYLVINITFAAMFLKARDKEINFTFILFMTAFVFLLFFVQLLALRILPINF